MVQSHSSIDDLLVSHGLEVVKKGGLTYAVADNGVFCVHPKKGDFCYLPAEDPRIVVDTMERYMKSLDLSPAKAAISRAVEMLGALALTYFASHIPTVGDTIYNSKVMFFMAVAGLPILSVSAYRSVHLEINVAKQSLKLIFNGALREQYFSAALQKAKPPTAL